MKKLFFILIFLQFFSSHALSTEVGNEPKLIVDHSLSSTNRIIISQLQRQHYHYIDINNQFSEQVFEHFLATLDKKKQFFLQEDILKFEGFKHDFDDALKSGNLSLMTDIFNIYIERKNYRYIQAINILEHPYTFDFSKNEWWSDKEPNQWQVTQADLNNLWRKKLKHQILVKMLKGEEESSARAELADVYRDSLSELERMDFVSAFESYINVVASLFDPHTQYMSPDAKEDFNINMSLSLTGIGAELNRHKGSIVVSKIIPNGPASEDGRLQKSDELIAVAKTISESFTTVKGWKIEEVVKLIRGPENSVVKLLVAKGGDTSQQQEIQIVRKKYVLEEDSASSKIFEFERNNQTIRIGVITIPSFYIDFEAWQRGDKNFKSASKDVKRLIKELNHSNVNAMILDLRDNGGGSLREANVITGLFLDEGPVVQVKLSNGYIELFHDLDDKIHFSGPLAVMVNRMSASASEIVAAALQDHGRAIVIGDTTFGKGTVQTLTPLEFGQLKLTQAKFYRVNGDSTQHKGVVPDIDFPSLYSFDNTGESSLENALAWDTISPLFYRPKILEEGLISYLEGEHKNRIRKSPAFSFARNYMKLQTDISRSKTFTLNKHDRTKSYQIEQKLKLDLINGFRESLGVEPVEDVSFDKDTTIDSLELALLNAAGEIVADWVNVNSNQYLGLNEK